MIQMTQGNGVNKDINMLLQKLKQIVSQYSEGAEENRLLQYER